MDPEIYLLRVNQPLRRHQIEEVAQRAEPEAQQTRQARSVILQPAVMMILLIAGLMLGAVSFWKLNAYREGVIVDSFVVSAEQPTSVVAILPENVDRAPVVLLVHMYSGSKEMMQGIAFALAKLGIACYLLDLPGHGVSPTRFEFGQMESRLATIRAVYDYLLEEKVLDGRVAVVGHSMGGALTGQLAVTETEIDGAVSISGVSFPGISENRPKNYLILAGEYDPPGIAKWARQAFREVGGEELSQVDTLRGSFRDRSARKLVVVPHTDHVMMVFHPTVIREIENWLARVFALETPTSGYEMRGWWLLLAHVALVMLFFPLVSFVSKWVLVQKTEAARFNSDAPPPSLVRIALAFILGVLSSLVVLSVGGPFQVIRLATADYLVTFLALVGVTAYPFVAKGKRISLFSSGSFALREICVGVVAFLYLYVTLSHLGSREYFYYTLRLASLSRMLVVLPLLFVFFIVEEQAVRSLQQARGLRLALVVSLGIDLLLVFVLSIAYQGLHLPNAPSFVMIASPYIVILFVIMKLFSGYLFQLTRNVLTTALFQMLLVAWLFAVVFPRT
jgi:pimeloyl-ACP methyl ester carboxylesterase